MNWDAASAIGEIVGSIAVLATLIYLARRAPLREDARGVYSIGSHGICRCSNEVKGPGV